jgi:S-adenosylmethionine:tRNA ribosyltransferase-isomerase
MKQNSEWCERAVEKLCTTSAEMWISLSRRVVVSQADRFHPTLMDARSISIDDYSYILPDDKIARFPLPERDGSRLLVYREGQLSDQLFQDLPSLLPSGSLLVFNDTRVIFARLHFRKPSGGAIEIFCLEPGPAYSGIAEGMQQRGGVDWKCLVGGAGKWKKGQVLEKLISGPAGNMVLRAEILAKEKDHFLIRLTWSPGELNFADLLAAAGNIPIPPYLKRESDAADEERYQTVYAGSGGSVAAPTAGLHFTADTLAALGPRHISTAFVTLHVGAGTFKPVTAARMANHDMHAEWISVSRTTIAQLRAHTGDLIAVGTTSARTLESLYWLALKITACPEADPAGLGLDQWEVYDKWKEETAPAVTALDNLLSWMNTRGLDQVQAETRLLIAPGYRFRIISGMLTNFHQPKSTLLLLVAALAGEGWKDIYQHALRGGYRFLSYGDSCLILPGSVPGRVGYPA